MSVGARDRDAALLQGLAQSFQRRPSELRQFVVKLHAVMGAKWDLGLSGGIVVANPIPVADEIPAERIGGIIARALADMESLGIQGKDITPYLLGRIVELTEGASLTANIALVRSNARLGAAIAREYAARN